MSADTGNQREPGLSSEIVLRFAGIEKSFGGQRVLGGAAGVVRRGEVILLRGPNGSGKTTLINVLAGVAEPEAGMIEVAASAIRETFEFPRRWWQRVSPADPFTPERLARAGVGRLWQDVRLFGSQSLRDNIRAAMPHQLGERPLSVLVRPLRVLREDGLLRERSDDALATLGLSGRTTSSADRVSLGQAKRVAILRAVCAGARILLLDEPLAGLDAQGIAQVLGLLRALARDHQVALMVVEHTLNFPVVLPLANTVWTLRAGRIVARAAAGARSVRPGAGKREAMGGRGTIAALPHGATLTVVRQPRSATRKVVLEVEDLVVYRGNRLVLGEERQGGVSGLSFRVELGDLAVLSAPNGWGKTTLLEAIAGLIPIARGRINLNGTPIRHLPPWKRFRMGLSVLQSRAGLFPHLTVSEALQLAGAPPDPPLALPIRTRRIGSLSGGERQRLALACSLRDDAALMVLDEPFSALDREGVRTVRKVVAERSARSAVLILRPAPVRPAGDDTELLSTDHGRHPW